VAAPLATSEAEILEKHGGAGDGRLALEIVSPSGAVAKTAADEVTAPGLLGEFGVLPGHVPFLSALKAGVLSWKTGGQLHVLAVDRGYLEVGAGNRVIVLTERALRPDDVNDDEAAAEIAAQNEAMKQGHLDTAGLELAKNALGWAQAQLAAVDKQRGRGAAAAH
jgi:F-type H+-transporting ATPase subunit epsilon